MRRGDTHEDAAAVQVAIHRRHSPSEKIRIAAEMSEDARRIAIEGEMRRHSELSPAEARMAVLRRMWGPELAALVSSKPVVGR